MALPRLRNLAGSFVVGRRCVKGNRENSGGSDCCHATAAPEFNRFGVGSICDSGHKFVRGFVVQMEGRVTNRTIVLFSCFSGNSIVWHGATMGVLTGIGVAHDSDLVERIDDFVSRLRQPLRSLTRPD